MILTSRRDPSSLYPSPAALLPRCTMASLRPSQWPLILVHMLLLQLQPLRVHGAAHLELRTAMYQKLRRLDEQFQQFQVLTQARLDMLALNQNRNSSRDLERQVQTLTDQYHQISQDLDHLKQTTTQEIDDLREWSRKLEKKSKRMEGRLALLERNLRESSRRHTQKQKPDLGQDFSNLTLALQTQEERLVSVEAQREELLVGLKGLQESLKNQELRMSRLEGRLGEVLQGNGGGFTRRSGRTRDLVTYNTTPQDPNRSLTNPDTSSIPSHRYNRTHPNSEHYHQPHPQAQAQLNPTEDRQIRTRLRTPPPQPQLYPNLKPQPQEEEERDGKTGKSAEIQNFLQLPVRQKIPAQPVTKKDATICNVDSMLFFPSSSVENYVTFSLSFPNLPELSVCLWLRVDDGHVGTLLSYATADNDNQLVLYGRDSSASSSSPLSLLSSPAYSASSSRSNPSYSSSSSSRSSPTLDFVVGDPVYRRLPAASLLDGRWHHLCVLWSSIQGRFWHYTDRRLTSSGSNFQKGWEVPGGGSVVLGQEQDVVGGGFDPTEGFAGRMAGLRVWDRVLSPMEVKGVAEGRGVPRGVVLGMEDIKEVHGEVKQVACECLEHCV
ncbi:pentraxin-4 [Diretmus argenteus]